MGKSRQLVPVSMRGLLQRINRKLARRHQALRKSKGEGALRNLGKFYHMDYSRNLCIGTGVNPERLGRDLGVLRPWEKLGD